MVWDVTIEKGTTSKICEVTIRDSTNGNGRTSLAYTDVTASYVREGGTRVAISLTPGSAGDAYSVGKWCEVDSVNCRGIYQLHLIDAALASGANSVTVRLQATGCIDQNVRVSLIDVDLRDSVSGGMSNLDAAASTLATAADLAIVDTVVAASNAILDKIDTALVVDGAVYQFTVNALENAPSGGGSAPTAGDIYNYFTAGGNEDSFKADVSGLATSSEIAALNNFDPSSDVVASVSTVTTCTTNSDMRGTDNSGPSRFYSFPSGSGTDYADSSEDVANNFPVVKRAMVRFKLSGSVSSSSDWRLRLNSPGGTVADLTTGLTIPSTATNYIVQAEADMSASDTNNGQWQIEAEDVLTGGSFLQITDASVEFLPDPEVVAVGETYTYTNGAGDTHQVTIS